MRFAAEEKNILLSVKGVGPKVIERIEQMGISSIAQLADADANDILTQGAVLSGSSCWKIVLKQRPPFKRLSVPLLLTLTRAESFRIEHRHYGVWLRHGAVAGRVFDKT